MRQRRAPARRGRRHVIAAKSGHPAASLRIFACVLALAPARIWPVGAQYRRDNARAFMAAQLCRPDAACRTPTRDARHWRDCFL